MSTKQAKLSRSDPNPVVSKKSAVPKLKRTPTTRVYTVYTDRGSGDSASKTFSSAFTNSAQSPMAGPRYRPQNQEEALRQLLFIENSELLEAYTQTVCTKFITTKKNTNINSYSNLTVISSLSRHYYHIIHQEED